MADTAAAKRAEAESFMREHQNTISPMFAQQAAFAAVRRGIISTKKFKEITGKAIYIAGRRDYSKWTSKDLREMRRRNGCGKPPHRR